MKDISRIIELLEELMELFDEPCRHDHHGYCQEHFLGDPCVIAELKNALAEYKAGWSPIETCPKDGTWFLAYYPADEDEAPFTECVKWPETDCHDMRGVELMLNSVNPTHWRHIPEPI